MRLTLLEAGYMLSFGRQGRVGWVRNFDLPFERAPLLPFPSPLLTLPVVKFPLDLSLPDQAQPPPIFY